MMWVDGAIVSVGRRPAGFSFLWLIEQAKCLLAFIGRDGKNDRVTTGSELFFLRGGALPVVVYGARDIGFARVVFGVVALVVVEMQAKSAFAVGE